MIDLKYHIASLVAVFMALGIGILVGSTIMGNDTLVDYQKQVTERLETQLESLRQKTETVQATANEMEMDLNVQHEFNNKVLPLLIGNRLENISLALVETNGYRYSSDILDALELAGARVTSVTSFLNFSEKQLAASIPKKIQEAEDTGDGQVTPLVSRMVATAILTGETANMDLLAESNIIRVSGNYGEKLDGIIVVGGCRDEKNYRAKVLDHSLIRVFRRQDIPVYGVEESSAGYSYMEFYQEQRLTATVDNIDTVPGQVALVLSIDGHPGNYGIKESAQRLLPKLDSGKEVAEGA